MANEVQTTEGGQTIGVACSSSSFQDWGLSLQEAPASHAPNEARPTEARG